MVVCGVCVGVGGCGCVCVCVCVCVSVVWRFSEAAVGSYSPW